MTKLIMAQTIYKTNNGVEIIISKGKKSAKDFKVHYREPRNRIRTPKHIHIIIDLYMKMSKNKELTMKLVDYIIEMIKKVKPAEEYPPKLQVFSKEKLEEFKELNNYGEYSVEFLLVVVELIMIQEATNYPTGTMNLRLFEKFRYGADIFSVVSAATFR
ncbi:MAG: hypothetical protein QXY05_01610 [Candidatus Anstonellales archaeon]